MRVGFGYDIHKLKKGRDLFLGGVKIPHEKGLDGYSDADVLIHAVADSILGACGSFDIGYYFPDTDPKYKGIRSIELLKHVVKIVKDKGFLVNNIDSVIIAEQPRISPYVEQIKKNLSIVIGIDENKIGVKATSNEGMDSIGQGLAIAAYAISSLIEK